MKRDGKPNDERDPPQRRAADRRGGSPRRQRGFVERATAKQGHSGHGSDSVLPHLRDQLRLKALMASPFPVPEQQQQHPGKDEQRH